MANREFKKWVKEAIIRMRISYSELTRGQKLRCPVRLLCIKPLQVSVLWIKRISSAKNRPFIRNRMLLIGCRSKDIKDLSIGVSVGEEIVDDKFEYASIYDFSSIFSGIKTLLSSPFWKSSSKKRIIEKIMIEFFREPRRYTNPIIIWRKPMVFVWSFEADLLGSVEKWLEKTNSISLNILDEKLLIPATKLRPQPQNKQWNQLSYHLLAPFFIPLFG